MILTDSKVILSTSLWNSYNLDHTNTGPPVEFGFRETGSSPLIVYATAFGGMVGK